jgi:hypothetical protein
VIDGLLPGGVGCSLLEFSQAAAEIVRSPNQMPTSEQQNLDLT